jgi:hypothetical protein
MVTQRSDHIHHPWMRSPLSDKILILSVASNYARSTFACRGNGSSVLGRSPASINLSSDHFHFHRVHFCKQLCIALSYEICIR